MNSPIRSTLACFAATALAASAVAQVRVDFQVTTRDDGTFDDGTLDRFPALPGDIGAPGIPHSIETGTAFIDGVFREYTGAASVQLVGPPDSMTPPFTLPFGSDDPFTFDFGNGDTFQMHYGRPDFGAPETGSVTITPITAEETDVLFLATFNFVPGSGTGEFAGLVDGELFMTAEMRGVNVAEPNIPYAWSSDVGFLEFIPEPGSAGLLLAGLLGVARPRR